MQDLVSEDYSAVKFWNGWKDFSDNPIPQTVEGYLEFLEGEVEFVGRRNKWIELKIKGDSNQRDVSVKKLLKVHNQSLKIRK